MAKKAIKKAAKKAVKKAAPKKAKVEPIAVMAEGSTYKGAVLDKNGKERHVCYGVKEENVKASCQAWLSTHPE